MITLKRSLILLLLISSIGFSLISCAGDPCLDGCNEMLQNCEDTCDDQFPKLGMFYERCRDNECWPEYQDCSYICLGTEWVD